MGDTGLDEETFFEYINEMQQEYTGEKVRFFLISGLL
jgi:hypothetical protein